MYNDDTRKEYSILMDYIESKFDNISDNKDFEKKFQELLENDEEFQIMIQKFNNVSVYNADAIHSAKDFLNLGEKLYPVEEDNKDKEETVSREEPKKVTETPKVSSFESKQDVVTASSPRVKVPFYKKAIDFVKNMPYAVKFVNGVSLGVFGTLTLFNAIGGGGLFYVAATIGLPIPAITAAYYGGKAIYKSFKNGKIRKWLDRNKNDFEPLPTSEIEALKEKGKIAEPRVEKETKGMEDIPFPNPDLRETEKPKYEPLPEIEKKDDKPKKSIIDDSVAKPKDKEAESKPITETILKDDEKSYDPATDIPVFADSAKHDDVVSSIPVVEPNVDTSYVPENYEYEEPIDNVTYDSSDFDFVPRVTPTSPIPEKKEEKVGRHAKKDMPIFDEGEKEKRISELENELQNLEFRRKILNAEPIFKEDGEKKALAERMVRENAEAIEKATQELNKLKGIKEEKNLATLLRSRKGTLTAKLAKIEDTEENKKLRDNIKFAISQIDKYINLDKQIRNNSLASDADRERLKQFEDSTYVAVEYILDETRNGSRSRK